jgi:hypothetical protein
MTQEFRVKGIDIPDEPFETKILDGEFTPCLTQPSGQGGFGQELQ